MRKYRDFENEIKDKSFRLETQKSLAEIKKKELEELIRTEKNDSNLLNEMQKTREELASQLRIQQESYESDEIYNEKLAKAGEANVSAVEKESQEIQSQFEKEEKKFEQEIEEKQREVANIKLELQKNEGEYQQKKEKIRENETILAEIEEKQQQTVYFKQKINEIDETLHGYAIDLDFTNTRMRESMEKQDSLTQQIKKINELRKIIAIKKDFEQANKQTSELQKQASEIQNELESLLTPLALPSHDLKQLKTKLVSETSLTNENSKDCENLQEQSRDLTASISLLKKEMQEAEKKQRSLEKSFSKSGITTSLKGETLDFSAKYSELKRELEDGEKKLIIMEFTQNDLQKYLLENSKKKSKCEFCEQPLQSKDIERLEKTVIESRREKGEKHCLELKDRIIALKKEKEALKNKKKDFENFCEIKKKLGELQTELTEKEGEKAAIAIELMSLQGKIDISKQRLVSFKSAIEAMEKLKGVEKEILVKEKHAAEISKNFKNKKDLIMEANEENMIENNEAFDQLEQTLTDVKNHEKRKNMLTNDINDFKSQKAKLEEFLRKNEEDDGKKTILLTENTKNNQIMISIRENTSKFIAKIKQTEVDKKYAEEQMKNLKRQAKISEKDIQKKRTLIEFLLPQFKQKIELIKAIAKKKSNRKEQEELELMKSRLQKDLKGMLEIISEYENFIIEKQKVLSERDAHFQLIDNNIKLKEIEKEVNVFDEDLKKKNEFLNEKKLEIDQLNQIKDKIEEEKLKYNSLKEKSKFYLESIEKENNELKLKASQTEETYIESLINFEIKQGIIHDLDIYVKTLEQTLLRYHRTKMEEINKIIADTWRV